MCYVLHEIGPQKSEKEVREELKLDIWKNAIN